MTFTMDVDIDCDASEVDRRRLLLAARKGCFVEQSLKPGIVKHRLKIDDRWLEVCDEAAPAAAAIAIEPMAVLRPS